MAEPDTSETPSDQDAPATFEQLSGQSDPGLIAEFWDFLRTNKKWWLTPIVIVTLLLCLAFFLTASPVAPFIYTLF